jgi:transposase
MFFRVKKAQTREYLQIVHNRREKGKVKQEVVATVGRLDVLKETGALDGLLRSGIKFSDKLALLDAHKKGEALSSEDWKIGLSLIFGRLWKETGIQRTLEEACAGRKFRFPIERAIYLTVLHRLSVSGSDRAAEKWREGHRIEGAEGLDLHQLYRAMGWLGEALPEEEQRGATPYAPRCTKDEIEEGIHHRRRDLFGDLSLVFFDTTSIYFEGNGGEDIGAYGHSKDHRPDLKQMVVGMIIDDSGRPICCELWPGNTTDVKTLLPVIDRLRMRFGIGKVCIVADRGMISEKTLRELQLREVQYILGVRMRRQKEVSQEVLGRGGRYEEVYPNGTHSKAPSPLKVKEIMVGQKRYIVCVNEDQAKKDAGDRETIIAALRNKLKQGDKSLVGNKGYRKYLKSAGTAFEIDEAKIKEDARYDGKWVLTTTTDLSARGVALQYKQLWMVEQVFRSMKTTLTTRPIYHKCDDTIRGHVFCSFLSLLLIKELQDRLSDKGLSIQWDDLINDLEDLKEIRIQTSDKDVLLRSELKGDTGKVFQAVGVAIPPKVSMFDKKGVLLDA